MRKSFGNLVLHCVLGCFLIFPCTSSSFAGDGLLTFLQKCICYGERLYLNCQGNYLAFFQLSIGTVPNVTSVDCQTNRGFSCKEYADGCMLPMEVDDKLIFYRKFSAFTRGLDYRIGQRKRLPTNCTDMSPDGFSNYVRFNYTCINENNILDMCSTYTIKSGKFINIRYAPEKGDIGQKTFCKCSAHVSPNTGSSLSLLAVDVRLTMKDGNCSRNHTVEISNENSNHTIACQNDMLLGEFTTVFDSETGNMSVELQLDGNDGDVPESVWFAVVAESESEVTVICGEQISQTLTTSAGGASAGAKTTKSNELTTLSPITEYTFAGYINTDSKGMNDSIRILIITCAAVVGLLALVVTVVGIKVYLKRRRLANHPSSVKGLSEYQHRASGSVPSSGNKHHIDGQKEYISRDRKGSNADKRSEPKPHAKVYSKQGNRKSPPDKSVVNKKMGKGTRNKACDLTPPYENIELDITKNEPRDDNSDMNDPIYKVMGHLSKPGQQKEVMIEHQDDADMKNPIYADYFSKPKPIKGQSNQNRQGIPNAKSRGYRK